MIVGKTGDRKSERREVRKTESRETGDRRPKTESRESGDDSREVRKTESREVRRR